MKKKFLSLAIVSLLILLLAGCFTEKKEETKKISEAQMQTLMMETKVYAESLEGKRGRLELQEGVYFEKDGKYRFYNFQTLYFLSGSDFAKFLKEWTLAGQKSYVVVRNQAVEISVYETVSDFASTKAKYTTDADFSIVESTEITAVEVIVEVGKSGTETRRAFAGKAVMEGIKSVETKIDLIPPLKSITLADKPTVTEARDAHTALPVTQQAIVLVEKKLIDAEARIAELEAELAVVKYAAIKAVVETAVVAYEAAAVGDLTTQSAIDVAIAKKPTVDTALTEADKTAFNDRITAATGKIAAAQKVIDDAKAATAVDALIGALPAEDLVAIADEAKVTEAETAYNALTITQKTLVTKLYDFAKAKAKIAELKKAADVNMTLNAFTMIENNFIGETKSYKFNITLLNANIDTLKFYSGAKDITDEFALNDYKTIVNIADGKAKGTITIKDKYTEQYTVKAFIGSKEIGQAIKLVQPADTLTVTPPAKITKTEKFPIIGSVNFWDLTVTATGEVDTVSIDINGIISEVAVGGITHYEISAPAGTEKIKVTGIKKVGTVSEIKIATQEITLPQI